MQEASHLRLKGQREEAGFSEPRSLEERPGRAGAQSSDVAKLPRLVLPTGTTG